MINLIVQCSKKSKIVPDPKNPSQSLFQYALFKTTVSKLGGNLECPHCKRCFVIKIFFKRGISALTGRLLKGFDFYGEIETGIKTQMKTGEKTTAGKAIHLHIVRYERSKLPEEVLKHIDDIDKYAPPIASEIFFRRVCFRHGVYFADDFRCPICNSVGRDWDSWKDEK